MYKSKLQTSKQISNKPINNKLFNKTRKNLDKKEATLLNKLESLIFYFILLYDKKLILILQSIKIFRAHFFHFFLYFTTIL